MFKKVLKKTKISLLCQPLPQSNFKNVRLLLVVKKNALWTRLLFLIKVTQKQPPEMFCKKTHFRIFANFTRKHLHWSLDLQFYQKETPTQVFFSVKFMKFLRTPILKNICERLLLTKRVCNFQSMKTPVELNSLLSKFFCYITWFVISPD